MAPVIQTKKRKFSLRGSGDDSFQLQTRDLSDETPLFKKRRRRDTLSRLLGAGGTRDTRRETDTFPFRRSWNRFAFVLTIIILTWIIGFFI
jgi:hypothetical protein